jgi:hypothetical protein
MFGKAYFARVPYRGWLYRRVHFSATEKPNYVTRIYPCEALGKPTRPDIAW